jgi:DNA-binding transcriptional LysR family regulator
MELRHPRYFAAPTLSHQIRALETMLGAKLFARRTKSAVALTHSGKRFVFAGADMQYLLDRRGDFSG